RETLLHAEESLAFLERPYMIKSSVLGEGRDIGQGKPFNLDKILDASLRTAAALEKRISTSDLNDELQSAVADHQPPVWRQRPVKLYFATQAESAPPLIVISANHG